MSTPNIRCSSLQQLLACPASLQLRAIVAPSKDSDASTLGSWCHYEAARRIVEFHGAVAADGALVPVTMPNGWDAPRFALWMVDYYLQTVLTYCDVDMALEVEAELAYAFRHFTLTGHVDVVGFKVETFPMPGGGDSTEVVTEAVGLDLKTGTEIVDEAEQNAQVLGYMVLLKLCYPTLRKVTFAICQPRNNPDEGQERITWATLEGDALDRAVTYLEREILSALDAPDQLNSDGWKQCRYCPAADQCPAIAADIEHMKMTLTPEHIANIATEPSVARLLEIELSRKKLSPLFDRAKDALKARVEAEGGEIMEEGVRIYVEERNSGREITDNKAATEALSALPDERFHRCYEFRPAAIEAVLAENETERTGAKVPVESKAKGKVSGKSLFNDLLGSVTVTKTAKWLRIAE
jgi:hypothetical protein